MLLEYKGYKSQVFEEIDGYMCSVDSHECLGTTIEELQVHFQQTVDYIILDQLKQNDRLVLYTTEKSLKPLLVLESKYVHTNKHKILGYRDLPDTNWEWYNVPRPASRYPKGKK